MVGEIVRTVSRERSDAEPGRPARVPLATGRPVRVPPRRFADVRAWCVLDGFERQAHTVHVASSDRIAPYRVVREARRAGHRPREVLATSRVARAFTAAQLTTLIHDRLEPHLHGAHALTLSDPLAMLAADEVPQGEARTRLDDVLEVLQDVADRVPVVVTQPPRRTPLFGTLRRATIAARPGPDGLEMPAGVVWWGPSRQTTLDAYRMGVST